MTTWHRVWDRRSGANTYISPYTPKYIPFISPIFCRLTPYFSFSEHLFYAILVSPQSPRGQMLPCWETRHIQVRADTSMSLDSMVWQLQDLKAHTVAISNDLLTDERWTKVILEAGSQLTLASMILTLRFLGIKIFLWGLAAKLLQDALAAEVSGACRVLHERQTSRLHVLGAAAMLPLGMMLWNFITRPGYDEVLTTHCCLDELKASLIHTEFWHTISCSRVSPHGIHIKTAMTHLLPIEHVLGALHCANYFPYFIYNHLQHSIISITHTGKPRPREANRFALNRMAENKQNPHASHVCFTWKAHALFGVWCLLSVVSSATEVEIMSLLCKKKLTRGPHFWEVKTV